MTTEKSTLLIRLHDETKASLKKAADEDERSMAFLAEKLIIEGLERRKPKKKPRA